MTPAVATSLKGRRKARRRTPQQERSQHTVEAILTSAKIMAIRSGVRGDATLVDGVVRMLLACLGVTSGAFPPAPPL